MFVFLEESDKEKFSVSNGSEELPKSKSLNPDFFDPGTREERRHFWIDQMERLLTTKSLDELVQEIGEQHDELWRAGCKRDAMALVPKPILRAFIEYTKERGKKNSKKCRPEIEKRNPEAKQKSALSYRIGGFILVITRGKKTAIDIYQAENCAHVFGL